jgi:hypothetical protein
MRCNNKNVGRGRGAQKKIPLWVGKPEEPDIA